MNTLRLMALFAVNKNVCRLGALIQLRFGRTAGLSGHGTVHLLLVTNI